MKSIGTAPESRAAEAFALLHRIGRQCPSAALASCLIDAANDNIAAEGVSQ